MTNEAAELKALQKKIIMVTTRLMTPRQWAKVRTVTDMSKDDVMNDGDVVAAVVAWFEAGADLGKFEDYLDMSTSDLEALVAGKDAAEYAAEFEATLDKALADADDESK